MNEITVKELEAKLEGNETVSIIDVREDEEVMTGTIPGAVHIPLGELVENTESLDKSQHYYVLCRSGGRSARATAFLTEKGYQATNIAGGILDWEGEMEF